MPLTRSSRSKVEPTVALRPSLSRPSRVEKEVIATKTVSQSDLPLNAKQQRQQQQQHQEQHVQPHGRQGRGKSSARAVRASSAAAPQQVVEFCDALKMQPELLLDISSVGGSSASALRRDMGARLQDMFLRLQSVSNIACALPRLFTEGFEGEQIWEQLSILDDAVQAKCSAAVQQVCTPFHAEASCNFLTPHTACCSWFPMAAASPSCPHLVVNLRANTKSIEVAVAKAVIQIHRITQVQNLLSKALQPQPHPAPLPPKAIATAIATTAMITLKTITAAVVVLRVAALVQATCPAPQNFSGMLQMTATQAAKKVTTTTR
jgi:hypothetical protein